jgi:hypothetical protein
MFPSLASLTLSWLGREFDLTDIRVVEIELKGRAARGRDG